MKTKLLLLFLLITTFAKSQISIQESFEGGTTPTNWSNNGIIFFNNSGFATTGNYSAVAPISIGSDKSLTTNAQITTGAAIDVSVQMRKQINAVGSFGLYYLLPNGSINPIQIEYFGNPYIPYHKISGIIPAGAIPAGTSVQFKIHVLGSAGSSSKIYFDDFAAVEQGDAAVPAISSISITSFQNSVNINYSLNANNATTNSLIYYGLSSGDLNNFNIGFEATGNAVTSDVSTITGLLTNTQYFYRIEAYNTAGNVSSAIESFTTTSSTPQVSTEYNFNATYKNTLGSNPFNAGTFVDDRNGNASSALTTSGSSATITANLLPKGSSSRSVSLWYKTTTNASYPGIFAYGSNATSQTFGIYLGPNGNPIFQGYNNDAAFQGTFPAATWQHIVVTYNGNLMMVYMNGSYIGASSYTLNTTTTLNDFRFSNGTASITYDDLKIYNYVLADEEILNLYSNNSTLTISENESIKSEVSIFPNPVKDILNIKTNNDLKSVEIYNAVGQNVLESTQKQINTSKLKAGMYLVRMTDEKNAVTTKKFIKN